jgi:replicative superfamily II helicase
VDAAALDPDLADLFPFDAFNAMQETVAPAILERDENVVVSAPTASGKTVLAELAIHRTLRDGGRAAFVAPMRALTSEKAQEWERFADRGYEVCVVTGDRDVDRHTAERADVLVMTPEKLDSATRGADGGIARDLDCCVIDEVHLLDSPGRGSALDVTIARLRRAQDPRIVALSATMTNVDDVAAWLDAPDATTFDFGDAHRPVELHTDVRTYERGENAFADKYRRLYRALDIAEPHLRDDGQALVFVASRRDARRAAEKARDVLAERDVPIGARGDYDLHTAAQDLTNDTLRQSVVDGVGFHHAGLARADRDRVEDWFRDGTLDLLFSTTTLAWGVNLPARCVVIRDTKYHDPLEGEVDVRPIDVRQMLGRAGRPSFDDVGYGWVIAAPEDADRYRRLLREGSPIESHLPDDLAFHLNAEIAGGTLPDLAAVNDWFESTFCAVRARAAPTQYDLPGLEARVRDTVQDLVDRGFVRDDDGLAPTALGRLASQFYVELPTAERFRDITGTADPDAPQQGAAPAAEGRDPSQPDSHDIVRAVAEAAEFASVSCRADEQEAVDAVVDALPPRAVPEADGARKVVAILRSGMRGETPGALRGDAWAIRQNADRLLAACRAIGEEFGGPHVAARVSRVAARVSEGVGPDAVGLTAIDGVGAGRAESLANAGVGTPAAARDAGADGLAAAGLSEGVAERVADNAADLPAIAVEWDLPETIERGANDMRSVTVRNTGGGARAGIRLRVNGREMSTEETYLGECTLPVGVFGADADQLRYEVSVAFPRLPLDPVTAERTVDVTE